MTTHTSSASVPGWSGAGCIIIDPKSGDGVAVLSVALRKVSFIAPVMGFLQKVMLKIFVVPKR